MENTSFRAVAVATVAAIVIFVCDAGPVWAKPSIVSHQGTVVRGESLTLQGADFGGHPDYSPDIDDLLAVAFQDFEAGQLEGPGFYLQDSAWGGLKTMELSDQGARSGSHYYLKKFFNEGRLGSLDHQQQGTTGTWFVSFWFMIEPDTQSGKFWRIWGADTDIYLSSGCTNTFLRGYAEFGPDAQPVWSSPDSLEPGRWHRLDIEMSEETGMFTLWMDTKLEWSQPWVVSGFGGDGHTISFGGMIDDPNDTDTTGDCLGFDGSYNDDDLFIDYTLARVELCTNGPDWSEREHCEIQLPTAWSDDSITVRVNQGALDPMSDLWAYVVDEQGEVSEGYLIPGSQSGGGDAGPQEADAGAGDATVPPSDGGRGADSGTSDAETSDDGCSCVSSNHAGRDATWWVLILLVAVALLGPKRRRRE